MLILVFALLVAAWGALGMIGWSAHRAALAVGGFALVATPLVALGGWIESGSPDDATFVGGWLMMLGVAGGVALGAVLSRRSSA